MYIIQITFRNYHRAYATGCGSDRTRDPRKARQYDNLIEARHFAHDLNNANWNFMNVCAVPLRPVLDRLKRAGK